MKRFTDYAMLSRYRSELMGVAMLWVMLFHAFDLDLGHPFLNLVRGAGFGGVDIFILLSSMGLALSLTRREQEYTAFMARRAGRILPAYYVVMVPYTLFLIVTQGVFWSSLLWNASLLYYWMRSAGAFNWYVAGAMTFYALTPFCLTRLRASRNRAGLTLVAIFASLAVCQLLTHEGFWYVVDFFYRVPVFFLGLLLGLYVAEERKPDGRGPLLWAGCLVAGIAYLVVSLRYDWISWPIHFPQCHMFLLTTVPMCFALCACFDRLPLGWLRAFLRLVGENSLEIYLLNVSLFSQVELLRRFVSFGPNNRLYYLLMFAVNIMLGWLLHRLVAKLWAGRQRPAAG